MNGNVDYSAPTTPVFTCQCEEDFVGNCGSGDRCAGASKALKCRGDVCKI